MHDHHEKNWQQYRDRGAHLRRLRGHGAFSPKKLVSRIGRYALAIVLIFAAGLKAIFSKLISRSTDPMRTWNWRTITVTLCIIAGIGALFGALCILGALAWYSRDLPDPNKVIDRVVAESTKIYDRTGKVLLYEIHGNEKRTIVELDQISPYIINGTIAAEDRDFYSHHGLKLTAIIRSVIVNVLRGQRAQGGSTITQQFVKQAILTTEKSFERKFKEWILAYQIEKKFSKEQILKMYFNEISFGGVNYGVESAAHYFFGKKASEVTLAEAAILAAIPQAPSRLSPYGSHTDELFARQRYVLDSMVGTGAITKEEAEKAKSEQLVFHKSISKESILAPHFVFYIREQLAEQLGEQALVQGGLTVVTTLDYDKQKVAEQAITDTYETIKKYGGSNAALVSVDAKNGQILAMVGSADYFNDDIDGQVNVALSPRQPGSSIKPMVYATAFERGYTPETVIYDVVTTFPVDPEPYTPKNYNLKEYGPVTFRKALAGSLNIPAVKALYLAGIENVKAQLEKAGYSTINQKTQCGLSLVLGGCEVELLDHVGAFTAFARDGERAVPAGILSVTDKGGKILMEFKEKKFTVFQSESARQLNSILSDDAARSYIFGTGSSLTLRGRPVAAKTGTTQKNRDNWTLGYTPSFVTGVWVGNSNGTSMNANATGTATASVIWNQYMSKTLEGTPVESFKAPEPLPDSLKPVLRGVVPDEVEYVIDRASGKLATEYTPETYKIKKKFRSGHDILYFVQKDNPRGEAPARPEDDPMFAPWEAAVADWLKREAERTNTEFTTEQPPTDYDDVHLPQYRPAVRIISPAPNEQITTADITVTAEASGTHGPISRVEYFLGGQLLGKTYAAPWTLTASLAGVSAGFQKLRAVAYDDIDNFAVAEQDLNLQPPYIPTTISWINPRDGASFFKTSFPLTVEFALNKLGDAKQIDFYYDHLEGGRTGVQIISATEFPTKELSFKWVGKTAVVGPYDIYARITDKNGTVTESPRLRLTVQ